MVVSVHFFFCSECGLLVIHQVEKKQNIIIRGGTGSTWGDTFYMGTQNGLKLEIDPGEF